MKFIIVEIVSLHCFDEHMQKEGDTKLILYYHVSIKRFIQSSMLRMLTGGKSLQLHTSIASYHYSHPMMMAFVIPCSWYPFQALMII